MNRCAGCGGDIRGDWVEARGMRFHPHCLRCSVCGEPMSSSFVVNPWGDIYCSHHQGELPSCACCGRPMCQKLTGGGVRYPDGRQVCRRCTRTAVVHLPAARLETEGVRAALARMGLDTGRGMLPLELVGQGELARRAGSPHAAGLTETKTRTLGWREERRVERVLVLYGLPREQFGAVVAHELGHVWLFHQGFRKLEPRAEEGMCELASYLWLKGRPGQEAAMRRKLIMENQDPVYGDGFRQAYRAMQKVPLPALLAAVRRSGRLQ